MKYYTSKGSCDSYKVEYLREPWRLRWHQRIGELQDEELLELKVELRQKMDLPVEPSDLERYKNIHMNQQVKLKGVNPTVPILENGNKVKVIIPSSLKTQLINLDELIVESPKPAAVGFTDPIEKHINIKEEPCDSLSITGDSGVNINEVSTTSNLPDPTEQEKSSFKDNLSNQDIIFLFGSFKTLSEKLQQELIILMSNMEKNDPERYRELQSSKVDDDDDEQDNKGTEDVTKTDGNSSQISSAANPKQGDETTEPTTATVNDDDDTVDDTDLMRRANEKAIVIELSDSDDNKELPEISIDLTEE